MSYRLDQSSRNKVSSVLSEMIDIPLGFRLYECPLTPEEIHSYIMTDEQKQVIAYAKKHGLEDILKADYSCCIEFKNWDKTKVTMRYNPDFTIWVDDMYKVPATNRFVDLTDPDLEAVGFVDWFYRYCDQAKDFNLARHGLELVEMCNSAGQLKRIIPDVFTYMPEDVIKIASTYERKPQLNDRIKRALSKDLYVKGLEMLNNQLNLGAILEEPTKTKRDEMHSKNMRMTMSVQVRQGENNE